MTLGDEGDGFSAIAGDIGEHAEFLDDVGNGIADKGFIVGDEYQFVGQVRVECQGALFVGAEDAYWSGVRIFQGGFDIRDIVNDGL